MAEYAHNLRKEFMRAFNKNIGVGVYLASLKKKIVVILRWSEKYTKTDMVYLAGGGAWLGLGYAIQVASGLILAVAFANFLPKESFGTYQFILSMAGILSVFTLSGMGVAITRAVALGDNGALRSGFRTKLAWNIGIAIASGAVALYYFINGNNELALGFLIVGAFSPFIEGFNLYQPFLIGKEYFKESVLLGAWRKPLPIVALITAMYFTRDPIVLILVHFSSHIISTGMLYWIVVKKYWFPLTPSKKMTQYSMHLSVMGIAGRIAVNADKILIFHFLGAPAVASFVIAQLPVKYTHNAINILQSLTLPKLAKRDYQTLQKTLPRKVLVLFLTTVILATIYIFTAPLVYPIIFSSYPESIVLSQVLALSLLLLPRSTYAHALTAHEKTRELYVIRFGIPAVKITLLAILLPLYGIWGAVFALLISDVIAAILIRVLFSRESIGPGYHTGSPEIDI